MVDIFGVVDHDLLLAVMELLGPQVMGIIPHQITQNRMMGLNGSLGLNLLGQNRSPYRALFLSNKWNQSLVQARGVFVCCEVRYCHAGWFIGNVSSP